MHTNDLSAYARVYDNYIPLLIEKPTPATLFKNLSGYHMNGHIAPTNTPVTKVIVSINMLCDNTYGQCVCDKCSDIVGDNLLGRLLTLMRSRDIAVSQGLRIAESTKTEPTRVINRNRDSVPRNHTYIGRGGMWGNPFRLEAGTNRNRSLRTHHDYLLTSPHLCANLASLRGETLVCFCKPSPCHGDNLAFYADLL